MTNKPAPAQRAPLPALVAFDFESKFDDGAWGKKVGEIIRGHAARRGIYTTYDEMSFAEAIRRARFSAGYDTPPEQVGKVARESLNADIAVYGTIERLEGESYELRVRAVEIADGQTKVIFDERLHCESRFAISPAITAALDRVEGKEEQPERDILADQSWRQRPNLVKNGGFEQGTITPDFWTPVNGLTSFWVDGASPTGKCVMLDTDVYKDQFEQWMERFGAGAPASQAPAKIQPTGHKYDTVGGTVGSHVYSDWIPIEQGAAYRLDFDVRGPAGNAKVFVKGYAEFVEGDFPAQRREVYRAPVHIHMKGQPGEWEHFARVFHPTQPIMILGFTSDFDQGAMARALTEATRKELTEEHDLVIADADKIDRSVAASGLKLTRDVNRVELAGMVRREFERGMAVWGEFLRKEEGGFALFLLGMDVRPGAETKFFMMRWDLPDNPEITETSARIASLIVERSQPVRYLRVKLDAYWPAGIYYFDNISITREPDVRPE